MRIPIPWNPILQLSPQYKEIAFMTEPSPSGNKPAITVTRRLTFCGHSMTVGLVVILALLWAIFFLIGSLPAIVKAVKAV